MLFDYEFVSLSPLKLIIWNFNVARYNNSLSQNWIYIGVETWMVVICSCRHNVRHQLLLTSRKCAHLSPCTRKHCLSLVIWIIEDCKLTRSMVNQSLLYNIAPLFIFSTSDHNNGIELLDNIINRQGICVNKLNAKHQTVWWCQWV